MSDLGTHPRKPLSPTQRLKLFEAHKGLCCLCGNRIIGANWIDEHIRPLGLGGGNELDNRGPAHIRCAGLKTAADLRRIAKAKAQKKRHLGIRPPEQKKIPSRPFCDTYKERRELSPLGPPRPMFRPSTCAESEDH
ncbi:MAG: endonuclease [Hyphomicrobiales bacterium]|nr:endonuclease [Hyphomicrobiales bacterium]